MEIVQTILLVLLSFILLSSGAGIYWFGGVKDVLLEWFTTNFTKVFFTDRELRMKYIVIGVLMFLIGLGLMVITIIAG